MSANFPPTKTQYFALGGGLDVESAARSAPAGLVLGGVNYESSALQGYERIGGFERFDGRPRPSDAAYRVFQSASNFSGVAVGNTVTGGTSAATAKVIALRGVNQIVVTRVAGAWQAGEAIKVGATTVGTLTQDASDFMAAEENEFYALAAADYRADIAAVPGSGPIRGIAILANVVYAWRDDAGGTGQCIYKSTSGGWVLVPFYRELSFAAGSGVAPAEGAVVTKGTSSAVVKRVVLQSGSWSGGTAAGRLIITSPTSEFSAGAFTAGITATCGGASTAITLLPAGRLDHVVYNFTGSSATARIYGADGVNRGFEFDGDVLTPIVTGMAQDKPTHVAAHRNHLFFSFSGSLQHSGVGSPYVWSAVLGAGELGAGDAITGLQVLPSGQDGGGALMVATAARTFVLYGSSSADWRFVAFSDDAGAQRWSIQSMGRVIALDALGISTLTPSQAFGNFERLPLSARIQSALTGKVVLASVVNRESKRMRLFFSGGDGLSISPFGESGLAFMSINYGKTVRCATSGLMGAAHRNFFGSDDGFVYEADRGRSFDGSSIFAYMKLAFNHTRSPSDKKRFRRADIEAKTLSASSLLVHGEYSLGAPEIGLTDVVSASYGGIGAYFDITNYDECFFDAPRHTVNKVRLDGVGTDLSLSLVSDSAKELPHTLQSISVAFTPRRLDR